MKIDFSVVLEAAKPAVVASHTLPAQPPRPSPLAMAAPIVAKRLSTNQVVTPLQPVDAPPGNGCYTCRSQINVGGVGIWSRSNLKCKSLDCSQFCVEGVNELVAISVSKSSGSSGLQATKL